MALTFVAGTGESLLFRGERDHTKPMSDQTILYALYRMSTTRAAAAPGPSLQSMPQSATCEHLRLLLLWT